MGAAFAQPAQPVGAPTQGQQAWAGGQLACVCQQQQSSGAGYPNREKSPSWLAYIPSC
jgi:hypothetical protein